LNPTPEGEEIVMSRIPTSAIIADAPEASERRAMITEMRPSSDVAFTDTVKALQARRGSRRGYAAMEARGGWQTEITNDLAAFIAAQRSLFLATANAEGQPYVQHRGGSPGFLRVLDARTLGFADFRGNRQHISEGNLIENSRAFLFLIDYAARSRIKIWGPPGSRRTPSSSRV
jgi:predicted pyridoxine 5'-phosphate oxidase superfamily flavin-nucleotide-binding protein